MPGPHAAHTTRSAATPHPATPAKGSRFEANPSSSNSSPQAGPSSDDIEKITTIEAITLEYSYLLSSQLEAMRQHYENDSASSRARLRELEMAEERARAAEAARQEAEKAKDKAERKAEKATEITRTLQVNLSAEKAMSEGLSARISKLQEELSKTEKDRQAKTDEVKELEEMVRDLMANLQAGAAIQASGGPDSGQGGDLVIVDKRNKKHK